LPKVIIIGCGYLGESAADLFFHAKWEVLGVCGTPESAMRLAAKPYSVQVHDITGEFAPDEGWRGADVLVHCASSGRRGAEGYRSVYLNGLLNALAAFQPRRALFVSSTSVYAQADGAWVDERSPAEPTRETGAILRDAEGIALATGGYVTRLSGIYGPGRSVLMGKFLAGEAIIEGGNDGRWINQIQRDDAAQAIFHLVTKRAEPGIYNVSDNTPARQRELYGWLAEFFQKPLPPVGEADHTRKRGWTSKRVSNARLTELGWSPKYPSYRDAIPSLASTVLR